MSPKVLKIDFLYFKTFFVEWLFCNFQSLIPGVFSNWIRLDIAGKPRVEAASLQDPLSVGANEDEVVLHEVHQDLADQLTHVHTCKV